MARTTILHRSFAAGEISTLLHGRVDLVPFQTGLALCQNFVTMPQGPARFRPGLQFQQYAAGSYARLVPFVYSDDQAYVVEFTSQQYIRIHTADGTLLDDAGDVAISEITNADPCVIMLAAGTAAGGDDVYLDVAGMPEVSGRWYRIVFQKAEGGLDHFTLTTPTMPGGIDSTGYGDFASGTASRPVKIQHPYLTNDLKTIRYAQSADVLTVVHPHNSVFALRRTGPNAWSFTAETFAPGVAAPSSISAAAGGPGGGTPSTHYYVATALVTDGSANAESLAAGPASASTDLTLIGNSVTISTSLPVEGTRHNYFKALNGLYGFIGQGGASFVDRNIIPDLSISPPEYGINFGANGDYPRAVTYYQQRKVFGGSINAPQSVWMTRTGTETDMTYTVPSRDDNAVVFRVASRELHTIRHMAELQDLLLFTSGGVWRVVAQNSDVITPSSVSAKLESYLGASDVQPVSAESSILYAFARGGRIGEVRRGQSESGYSVSDLALLAPHLFDGYHVVDMALMETPTRVLWVVRSDGALLSMTYQPEHQIVAWHQHDVGGAVKSIAVIPSITDESLSEDVLWAFVEREGTAGLRYHTLETLSGLGDYPVERKTSYWIPPDDLARAVAVHSDSAVVYTGPDATRIIGLHHLEGRTVAAVSNGAVHPPLVVANGEIVLEFPASHVVVGLPYRGRIKSLPLQIEGMRGVAADGQGRMKNVNAVHLRLFQTGGVWVGPDFERMDEMKARTDEPYGAAPRWKSGEFETVVDPLWAREGAVCIEQRDPLPLVLLSMATEVEIGG